MNLPELPQIDSGTWIKGFSAIFGSGGIGAFLFDRFRRRNSKGDLRDARAADTTAAEAEKEKADAQLVTALNGVAERWLDRAETKLQQAEGEIAKLREDLHRLRNDLTRYRGMEVENERLKLQVQQLEAENAELRSRPAA